jgi:hypothetical protein
MLLPPTPPLYCLVVLPGLKGQSSLMLNDMYHSLLESGFVPSSKTSPSSFYRELGELLSAEFDPKSDSAAISNSAELCLCQVLMKNDSANKKKTWQNINFTEFPTENTQ